MVPMTFKVMLYSHTEGACGEIRVTGHSRISFRLREYERETRQRLACAVLIDPYGNVAGVAAPHSRNRWSVAFVDLRTRGES